MTEPTVPWSPRPPETLSVEDQIRLVERSLELDAEIEAAARQAEADRAIERLEADAAKELERRLSDGSPSTPTQTPTLWDRGWLSVAIAFALIATLVIALLATFWVRTDNPPEAYGNVGKSSCVTHGGGKAGGYHGSSRCRPGPVAPRPLQNRR